MNVSRIKVIAFGFFVFLSENAIATDQNVLRPYQELFQSPEMISIVFLFGLLIWFIGRE